MKVTFFSVRKFTEGGKHHEKLAGVYVIARGCKTCAENANTIAISRGCRSERRLKQTRPNPKSLEAL